MEDTICPRCKTTKFQNPHLKMMVNVCGHALCESCVDLLFLKGSGACPECKIPLRRNNFRIQLFEDASVEKEVDIRKRVLKDFNKKEEDFLSLREYNDYLEEIESIIYNLTNDIDIVNTNKRIEEYKKLNKEHILKNKSKLSRDEYELEEILEMEKHQEQVRKTEMRQEEVEAKKKKLREKEALIDELMFSNASAKNIVETFAQSKEAEIAHDAEISKPVTKAATQFSTGIQFGRQTANVAANIVEGPLYIYKPQPFVLQGPQPPRENDFTQLGYYKHIRNETEQEKAGGFTSSVACIRALQDALAGLYHIKTTGV